MMNKNYKLMGLVLVLLVGLVGLTSLVSADSDLYDITEIAVDGITVWEDSVTLDVATGVELDNELEIEVYIDGTGMDTDACYDIDTGYDCPIDVKVKVWLGGYEYDDIEVTSATFDIEPGVSYRRTLTLELPEDMDVEEDNLYTLYVEVFDDENDERASVDLFTERPRHSLKVQDVVYDSSVDAGDMLPVEVRIENLGETKEEDIRVDVSLVDAEGNVVASDAEYLDELAAWELDNEDEESSESIDLLLSLGDNLKTGSYDLVVELSYNRGHDSLELKSSVYLTGVEEEEVVEGVEAPKGPRVTITLSSDDLDVVAGEDATFTLTFLNTGDRAESFTVDVQGISQWAESAVSPSSVLVDAGQTKDVTVSLAVDESASGINGFSVLVLNQQGRLIKDVSMSAEVAEADVGLLSDSGSMLKVGFIALIVLVIIVGLIIAFRRLNDDDDDDDPLEPKEGKTYY
ncbi:MAG: hypothetical protein Q8Q35_02760 [Nanoarchaeota archaeon]|nr:hypothetical protein [Nanoarchaeota archaeon]